MGVVKGPAMSIAASGNVGPICYSRWRDLQIARGVWTGTVESTPAQETYQGHLALVAFKWGGVLSEEERESWRLYAREATFRGRFGDPVHYSGYTLFVSRNMNLQRWGQPVLKKPIVDAKSMIYYDFYMKHELSWEEFVWRAYNFPTGFHPDVHEGWVAGPYDSPGRVALDNEYRMLGYRIPASNWIRIGYAHDDKWYWMRHRFGDFSGVVAPFQTRHVFAG